MPLLRNGRLQASDAWQRLGDDDDVSADSARPLAVSLDRYLADLARSTTVIAGVWLKPDDDVTLLTPHVDRLQLIAIDFPAYTDGRGYSQARLLRGRLGFNGEIRAVGDVRPDQLLFMMRAGIDAFEMPEAPDEAVLHRLLSRYRSSYQPSYALPIAG